MDKNLVLIPAFLYLNEGDVIELIPVWDKRIKVKSSLHGGEDQYMCDDQRVKKIEAIYDINNKTLEEAVIIQRGREEDNMYLNKFVVYEGRSLAQATLVKVVDIQYLPRKGYDEFIRGHDVIKQWEDYKGWFRNDKEKVDKGMLYCLQWLTPVYCFHNGESTEYTHKFKLLDSRLLTPELMEKALSL